MRKEPTSETVILERAACLFPYFEQAFGIQLSAAQVGQLKDYLRLLANWNTALHLTSMKDVEAWLRFHFFESFWAAQQFLNPRIAVADVGSGAGFPGLAMKLYQPSLDLTLIEKNYKKTVFLRLVARHLSLPARIFKTRGESFIDWPSIQLATLRALKPSHQLLAALARHRILLLLFHGRQLDPSLRSWVVLKQKRVPHSIVRQVTLLHLPTDQVVSEKEVSRETPGPLCGG